ncbi:hypothetical protein [Caballeronia sordidicola]|uniref:Uncharacterized protein n=1 Tax=Caballeronia sordidicola TaxID=196367 RepID=A0A242MM27_CABSO|nr:hypothetical protein [Caballeronia sordidicola]OTP72376.1 hypothetical protein PAMC26510_21355 [Caballeronia sordidicola]
MKASLKGRIDALELAAGADFVEVIPLGYFYGEDVQREKIPRKEFLKRSLRSFYEEENPNKVDK